MMGQTVPPVPQEPPVLQEPPGATGAQGPARKRRCHRTTRPPRFLLDKMEMTVPPVLPAHKGHKESKEPQAHRGASGSNGADGAGAVTEISVYGRTLTSKITAVFNRAGSSLVSGSSFTQYYDRAGQLTLNASNILYCYW